MSHSIDLTKWSELAGSPTETLTLNGATAVQRFIGPWDERWDFARQIFSGTWYFFQQAWADPLASVGGNMFPRTITMAGYKGEQQGAGNLLAEVAGGGDFRLWAKYEKAVVTVNYSTPQFGDPVNDGTGLISETISPVPTFLKLDPDIFVWEDGAPVRDEESPGKLHNVLRYTLVRHNIDVVSQNAYNLVDHVNVFPLIPLTPSLGTQPFEFETVLYEGCNVNRSENIDKVTQTISMSFLIKRVPIHSGVGGHNHFWRANTQKWERINIKDDVDNLPVNYANFPSADLGVL